MLTRTLVRRASLAISVVASAFAVNGAGAQSLMGRWEGNIYAQGSAIPVVITLDSASAGWSGTLLVSQLNPEPIIIAAVTVKKDTISMQLPESGMSAFLQGLLTPDKKTLNGMVAVQGDNSGSFQVMKVVTPGAVSPAPRKQ